MSHLVKWILLDWHNVWRYIIVYASLTLPICEVNLMFKHYFQEFIYICEWVINETYTLRWNYFILFIIIKLTLQVIPWVISDSQYTKSTPSSSDIKRTVFVGALHALITAEILVTIMNDLFGNVIFAALDTDKYKYPIGRWLYGINYM